MYPEEPRHRAITEICTWWASKPSPWPQLHTRKLPPNTLWIMLPLTTVLELFLPTHHWVGWKTHRSMPPIFRWYLKISRKKCFSWCLGFFFNIINLFRNKSVGKNLFKLRGGVKLTLAPPKKWKWTCQSLNCVQLFAAPWTVVYQAPLSMEFSRQEYLE